MEKSSSPLFINGFTSDVFRLDGFGVKRLKSGIL
jgi:hypothetical protein